MKLLTSELKKIIPEKVARGLLLDVNIHPDKETELDIGDFLIEAWKKGEMTNNFPMYEREIDQYDNDQHPNDWDGHCLQCYVNEGKVIYHKFKSMSVVRKEKRERAENKDKKIDGLIDDIEKIIKILEKKSKL